MYLHENIEQMNWEISDEKHNNKGDQHQGGFLAFLTLTVQ